jgi:hypothetical protein
LPRALINSPDGGNAGAFSSAKSGVLVIVAARAQQAKAATYLNIFIDYPYRSRKTNQEAGSS